MLARLPCIQSLFEWTQLIAKLQRVQLPTKRYQRPIHIDSGMSTSVSLSLNETVIQRRRFMQQLVYGMSSSPVVPISAPDYNGYYKQIRDYNFGQKVQSADYTIKIHQLTQLIRSPLWDNNKSTLIQKVDQIRTVSSTQMAMTSKSLVHLIRLIDVYSDRNDRYFSASFQRRLVLLLDSALCEGRLTHPEIVYCDFVLNKIKVMTLEWRYNFMNYQTKAYYAMKADYYETITQNSESKLEAFKSKVETIFQLTLPILSNHRLQVSHIHLQFQILAQVISQLAFLNTSNTVGAKLFQSLPFFQLGELYVSLLSIDPIYLAGFTGTCDYEQVVRIVGHQMRQRLERLVGGIKVVEQQMLKTNLNSLLTNIETPNLTKNNSITQNQSSETPLSHQTLKPLQFTQLLQNPSPQILLKLLTQILKYLPFHSYSPQPHTLAILEYIGQYSRVRWMDGHEEWSQCVGRTRGWDRILGWLESGSQKLENNVFPTNGPSPSMFYHLVHLSLMQCASLNSFKRLVKVVSEKIELSLPPSSQLLAHQIGSYYWIIRLMIDVYLPSSNTDLLKTILKLWSQIDKKWKDFSKRKTDKKMSIERYGLICLMMELRNKANSITLFRSGVMAEEGNSRGTSRGSSRLQSGSPIKLTWSQTIWSSFQQIRQQASTMFSFSHNYHQAVQKTIIDPKCYNNRILVHQLLEYHHLCDAKTNHNKERKSTEQFVKFLLMVLYEKGVQLEPELIPYNSSISSLNSSMNSLNSSNNSPFSHHNTTNHPFDLESQISRLAANKVNFINLMNNLYNQELWLQTYMGWNNIDHINNPLNTLKPPNTLNLQKSQNTQNTLNTLNPQNPQNIPSRIRTVTLFIQKYSVSKQYMILQLLRFVGCQLDSSWRRWVEGNISENNSQSESNPNSKINNNNNNQKYSKSQINKQTLFHTIYPFLTPYASYPLISGGYIEPLIANLWTSTSLIAAFCVLWYNGMARGWWVGMNGGGRNWNINQQNTKQQNIKQQKIKQQNTIEEQSIKALKDNQPLQTNQPLKINNPPSLFLYPFKPNKSPIQHFYETIVVKGGNLFLTYKLYTSLAEKVLMGQCSSSGIEGVNSSRGIKGVNSRKGNNRNNDSLKRNHNNIDQCQYQLTLLFALGQKCNLYGKLIKVLTILINWTKLKGSLILAHPSTSPQLHILHQLAVPQKLYQKLERGIIFLIKLSQTLNLSSHWLAPKIEDQFRLIGNWTQQWKQRAMEEDQEKRLYEELVKRFSKEDDQEDLEREDGKYQAESKELTSQEADQQSNNTDHWSMDTQQDSYGFTKRQPSNEPKFKLNSRKTTPTKETFKLFKKIGTEKTKTQV